MELTVDELAGIVDLFGGLTREELKTAIADLAAKGGVEFDEEAADTAIATAIDEFVLIELDSWDEPLLAVGPSALPILPEYGEDLPHILSIEPRSIDQEELAHATETRLRAAAAQAVNNDDTARAEHLLDTCYELDAGLSIDTSSIRERLDAVLD